MVKNLLGNFSQRDDTVIALHFNVNEAPMCMIVTFKQLINAVK